jgi:hypothetical protein
MIPSISRDGNVERAAKDQTVRSFVAPDVVASDLTPGQLAANNGGQTFANKTITIDKVRKVEILWQGEEQRGMNSGPGYNNMLMDQMEQGFRTLANEIESDLCALHVGAARAVDPAGTNLFDAANYLDVANINKELNINGAPAGDRSLVLSNAAAARFRGNATYTAANTAGGDAILRQGVLLDQFGTAIRESNQIVDFTKGTGASYLLNDASSAIGDTVIAMDTGSGTILAGDIISFAGDANKYVVEVALSAGNLTIAAPGLKVALADNAAVTVEDEGQRNMAFSRDAIHLVTRVPARPMEGDSAEDVMIIQDPRSGLAFEVAMYKEYRQVKFEIALAWGYEMIKPEHCMLLVD